jgi:hypothetical protein
LLIVLTLALFAMGYSFRSTGVGIITRAEGILLLLTYAAYNIGLTMSVVAARY